jgi:hypothetical protein
VGTGPEHAAYWETLSDLWGRSTGGSKVAAHPGAGESRWPTSQYAAGVEEAGEWFTDGMTHPAHRLLLFIGGPGSGKSHKAADLVSGLKEIEPKSPDRSYRIYRYKGPHRQVVVVNDATIGSGRSDGPAALVDDLETAIRDGHDAIACVNRGILLEEVGKADRTEQSGPGAALLRAVLERPLAGDDEVWVEVGDPGGAGAVIWPAAVKAGPRGYVEVLAVFMDATSLMESAPQVQIVADPPEAPTVELDTSYRVCRFDRRTGELGDRGFPAGDLVSNVLFALKDEVPEPDLLDPIGANIQSLSSPAVRSGWLTVLRGAEIISGWRMSYREVWGALVQSILGVAAASPHPGMLRNTIVGLQPAAEANPLERFEAMRVLAGFRMGQALFGVGLPRAERLAHPVLRATSVVDPIRDQITGGDPGAPAGGWAGPIVQAFSASSGDGSPLGRLRTELATDDPFREAEAAFDRALDDAYVAARSTTDSEEQASELAGWYGRYLTRLYAISNGIPAFHAEALEWTRAWFAAPDVPQALEQRLRTLLMPSLVVEGDPAQQVLLPVFASRVEPLSETTPEPVLAVYGNRFELGLMRRGDAVEVVLRDSTSGDAISTITLNFALLRETLACSGGERGITDCTREASPRLERLRAAQLAPNQLNGARWALVSDQGAEVVTVRSQP